MAITHSAEETIRYGQKFAKTLHGGDVIGLIGDLGAGKTTFIKGLAEGLGIKEPITSPTFVLLKEFKILRPNIHLVGVSNKVRKLVHVDAYRIESIEDIKSVGIDEYFGRDDVIVLIEWAEKIKKLLPKDTVYINFEHIDEFSRKIQVKIIIRLKS